MEGKRLRRTRAVLRAYDPRQEHWHSAHILIQGKVITLETFWAVPSQAELTKTSLSIEPKCFAELLNQKLVEHDRTAENDDLYYRFTAHAMQRLGV